MKNNTELRYDRYIRELEEIEKKRARKVKQILEVKKRLKIWYVRNVKWKSLKIGILIQMITWYLFRDVDVMDKKCDDSCCTNDESHCAKCGCYWQVSNEVARSVGCECDCHDWMVLAFHMWLLSCWWAYYRLLFPCMAKYKETSRYRKMGF